MTNEEFEKELEELHEKSYCWALSLCHDPNLAEDILQDAYVKALNSLSQFKQNSSFKTWLFTIIRNTSYDNLKKVSNRKRIDEYSLKDEKMYHTSSQEMRLRKKKDNEVAQALILNLSRREKEVIELIVYQDLTLKEAAHIMGVTVGSVSSYLKRAKASLKGEILENKKSTNIPDFEKTYTYNLKKTDT